MRERLRQVLSVEDLAELASLETGVRGLHEHGRRLAARLGARRSPGCARVGDRLLCILHDCLAPALRDLASIHAEARELRKPPLKRRRTDGSNGPTRKHPR